MDSHSEINALPEPLKAALRALGDVRAPAALGERVSHQLALGELGGVEAPRELGERVFQQLALEPLAEATAPAALWQAVAPEMRRIAAERAAPAPVFAFSRDSVRRLAVAAALLLAVGTGMLLPARPSVPQSGLGPLAFGPKAALRDYYAAQAIVFEVAPERISSVGHGLAGMLGASLEGGSFQ